MSLCLKSGQINIFSKDVESNTMKCCIEVQLQILLVVNTCIILLVLMCHFFKWLCTLVFFHFLISCCYNCCCVMALNITDAKRLVRIGACVDCRRELSYLCESQYL